jgi:hypothetical protein
VTRVSERPADVARSESGDDEVDLSNTLSGLRSPGAGKSGTKCREFKEKDMRVAELKTTCMINKLNCLKSELCTE